MKKSRVCSLLSIEHPIIQAGLPWVSNPELVAAVSNAGGLGMLSHNAGLPEGGDIVKNLHENIRRVRHLTDKPFGLALFLGNESIQKLMEATIEEAVKVVVTYGGSPAIYTGHLKENNIAVIHHVGTVRHARGAEAQGVDAVIADGNEGGGRRGYDELPSMVLIPQVADAVNVPVIANAGIMDARGYVAAMALGAQGVQLESRFIATKECAAHSKVKEAILSAIDTGTVVVGRYHIPIRLLRASGSLKLRNGAYPPADQARAVWESHFNLRTQRLAMLEGDLENGMASCDAAVGLICDIVSAGEVVEGLVKGATTVVEQLKDL